MAHKAKNAQKTPAPKNFWPYSYQFYLCNPVRTFFCIVHDANTNPRFELVDYVEPDVDRSTIASLDMPAKLLKPDEVVTTYNNAEPGELISGIKRSNLTVSEMRSELRPLNERQKLLLPLREDTISTSRQSYQRRIILPG